ncbi:tyrosine-type recombinase/integrase [Desulfobacula phenolica]|uniref:Site-specific recombinase XerD n=1 Tax=Desulfobacula phenolica TaxID=90732 RepID=A0A1H2KC92_9BACT|nr:site-specific integrase [Desulfobacula phenolica]SDU66071.1 Site-specific recombinase XerD [Desulfobacula phenolica]
MSVHKTKTGNYFCKYRITDETGKRKEKRDYFGKGLEGEKLAIERDEELKQTGAISEYKTDPKNHVTIIFSDLAEQYLASKANDLPETSIKNMLYKFKGRILPELGHLAYNQITHHRLDLYVKKRLKTPVVKRMGKDGQKIVPVKHPDGSMKMTSKTTVHRELSDIIAILNWAVSRKYIPQNHAAGYRKPKRDDQIIRPPSPGEVKKIIKHGEAHLKRALLINYYTGLRPGNAELYNLQWYDIDWDNLTLLVRSAKKGGPVKRSVAIHPALLKQLKIWKKEDENNTHPYIIYWKNKPVKRISSSFNTAKRKAGITRRLRPYDFRHAAITQMIIKGDLKAASEIAGHSNIEMTIKQYEHITSEIKRKTVSVIEEIDI